MRQFENDSDNMIIMSDYTSAKKKFSKVFKKSWFINRVIR